jgi:hypothetical protein
MAWTLKLIENGADAVAPLREPKRRRTNFIR